MRKVNFLIGGAPKAGSTSLAKMVGELKDYYLHDRGYELQFFGKDKVYKKGIAWYDSLFQGRTETCIGEKSTSYILHPRAAERIKAYNPDMKIIFILRNPVFRAYSQYKQNIANGTEYLSFEKAIRIENRRRKLGGFFANNYAYLSRGYYYEQLKPFYDTFPSEQIKIFIFDEFLTNPEQARQEVCDFLGIPCELKAAKAESKHSNRTRVPKVLGAPFIFMLYRKYVSRYMGRLPGLHRGIMQLESRLYKDVGYEQMPDELQSRLQRRFGEANKKLERLLDRELTVYWNA